MHCIFLFIILIIGGCNQLSGADDIIFVEDIASDTVNQKAKNTVTDSDDNDSDDNDSNDNDSDTGS